MKRQLLQASLVGSLVLGLAASTACGGGGGGGGGGGVGPSDARWDLKGTVRDQSNAPLYSATVEVADGSNVGRSVATSMEGAYSLVGLLQGGFTLKASKRGYVAVTRGVTLTSNTTADLTLAQDVPSVSVAFDPTTIATAPSSNREYPIRLAFILQVRESHYVDATIKALVFKLTQSNGTEIVWLDDTEELRERYGSLLVRGGNLRLLNTRLIYDGEPRGTLKVTLQATGPDAALYASTAMATVVPGSGASASTFDPAVRPSIPER